MQIFLKVKKEVIFRSPEIIFTWTSSFPAFPEKEVATYICWKSKENLLAFLLTGLQWSSSKETVVTPSHNSKVDNTTAFLLLQGEFFKRFLKIMTFQALKAITGAELDLTHAGTYSYLSVSGLHIC